MRRYKLYLHGYIEQKYEYIWAKNLKEAKEKLKQMYNNHAMYALKRA